MPFDAEAPVRAADLVGVSPAQDDLGLALATARDPSPALAETDPARLIAFLFVSPRPCAALDALLDL